MAPGHAYIYFIYGMYHCLNFVTEPEGEPSAVLLRGLKPAAGAETMKHLRFGDAPMNAYRRKNFLNGPGKVCKALDLTTAQNKLDLEGDGKTETISYKDTSVTDEDYGNCQAKAEIYRNGELLFSLESSEYTYYWR